MKNDSKSSFDDEITLKELILKVKEYIDEMTKYWWLVTVICVIITGYYLYNHYTYVGTYKAELKFAVEGQNSGGGNLSTLLGSFGVGKNDKVNPYKVVEVAKSTNIFNNLISVKTNDGQNIGNKLIEFYELDSKWAKDNPDFQGFRFKKDTIQLNGNLLEQNAIKKLQRLVWGNNVGISENLTEIDFDENTGLYLLTTTALDEELSILITKTLYQEIKSFFEIKAFSNQRQLSKILQSKADSIKVLMDSKIRELAAFQDRNRNMVSRLSESTMQIITQENIALGMTYSEVLKNKEMADLTLKDRQPLFMVIETPFSPLSKSSSSIVKNLILALFLGFFISIVIILSRKIYRDIMST